MAAALQRFVDAQAPVFDDVLAELRGGRKRTHWMWFVFPQLAGLGHSAMAHHYALSSLTEARDYLRHPLLGPRLEICGTLVLEQVDRSVDAIFGTPGDRAVRRLPREVFRRRAGSAHAGTARHLSQKKPVPAAGACEWLDFDSI